MAKVKEAGGWPVSRDVEIKNGYFSWLVEFVKPDDRHWCLLRRLHQKDYIWLDCVPLDENRDKDGRALRVKFANDSEWPLEEVLGVLEGPCSVLEMLVAMAMRIETDILYDAAYGDRTGEWFWMILNNAHLNMNDDEYYQIYIDQVLNTILSRWYDKNSEGSFFPVKNTCGRDWRKTDLWMQMQLYFEEHM